MTALITAALTLVSLVLEALAKRKTTQEATSADTNVQDMREALSDNDSAGVAARLADQHDRVQQALCCDPGWGNNTGEQEPVRPDVSRQREPVEGAGRVPGE